MVKIREKGGNATFFLNPHDLTIKKPGSVSGAFR